MIVMAMTFKDVMVGQSKADTEYFGDLEAGITETEDVDHQMYLLIKSQSAVISLAVIQTSRHLRTQILCFRDMSSIAVMHDVT